MLARLQVFRATWTIADQAIVSLGAFLANIVFARHLLPSEYGAFALLQGALLTLQLVNACLLFHPLSVRLVAAVAEREAILLRSTFALVMLMCSPLCAGLAAILVLLGRGDLVTPAIALFLLWQIQETTRRSLLAGFRHKAAIVGDAISYVGQALAIIALAHQDMLTMVSGLYCMAATSALAAVVQGFQLRASLLGRYELRRTARDYWSVGGGWSLGNGLLAQFRLQMLIWVVAIMQGAAAAASMQAALNVVNVANPVLIGLCNLIPQTTAHSQLARGNRGAWQAARIYIVMGIPPLLTFYAVLALVPELALRTLYPPDSPYLALSLAVQLLTLAFVLGYGTEMFCSFLHGLAAPRLALLINAIGAGVTAALAFPLIDAAGVEGACVALVANNVVRLAASYVVWKRVTHITQPQPA